MRVIAGRYKGRSLKGPKHKGLRPTADRVKEALFNIIGAKIVGADFLDLFAGSGGIGIEAISRGASQVVFADNNSASLKLVAENLQLLAVDDQTRLLRREALQAIKLLAAEGSSFDIIFLDPPFEAGLLDQTIAAITASSILKAEGWLIAEHPQRVVPASRELRVLLNRNYGDINLSIYSRAIPGQD